MKASFHHVALSVRDLAKSKDFYEKFGFKQVHEWGADDGSIAILHLKNGPVILELFAHQDNADQEELSPKRPPPVGMWHIALNVADVRRVFEAMKGAGYTMRDPEVKAGRTGIDYFFVKDPDGNWVEIVQDDRDY